MRVLLVITKAQWGGATRYVYDLACHLKESGHDVQVAHGGHGPLRDKLAEEKIPTHSLENLQKEISPLKDIRAIPELRTLVEKTSPDIVHLNSSKAGVVGSIALLGKPCKSVFTVHGFAFNENRSFLSKSFFKLLYFFIFIRIDQIIAVSENIQKTIQSWPLIKKKSLRIHLGIESPDFLSRHTARKEISRILPEPIQQTDGYWILTIAELHKSKGIETALAALAILKERLSEAPKYFIIGAGSEKTHLKHMVAAFGLEQHVFFLGFVESAARYLPAADLFVLPSNTEALGYVLLESGLAQRPVIASRVGGIPEIISHNETGLLVPPSSPGVLAEAIEELFSSPEKSGRLSLNLCNSVKERFSIQKMSQETVTMYKNMLSR